jgi:lipoprotein-anchoring transpeptidase ErfK/SrfK
MRSIVHILLVAGAVYLPAAAEAKVHITVDLDAQTIHVEAKDRVYDWKVSSGARGYDTPPGTYGVLWTDKDHHSDEYDGAPMPNAIFFRPGFAIHGAYKSDWGHPASHGCVRLPVAQSAILFQLVKAQGAEITITGGSSASAALDRRAPAGTQRRTPNGSFFGSFFGAAPN